MGGEGRESFFSPVGGPFRGWGVLLAAGKDEGKSCAGSGRRLKNFENLEIFEFFISINSGISAF